jgi:cytidine deaminase
MGNGNANIEAKVRNLLQRAQARHGEVVPCGRCRTFRESLTRIDNRFLCLWYNTPDGNSHVVIEEIEQGTPPESYQDIAA